jgi:solute carrier family 35 protein C2
MTLSVAGIFKEIATILLSSNVFGDELTPINVTGLCIALTGIGMYNYLKYSLLIRNNNNLLQQGQGGQVQDQGYSHRPLQQDDEERCTEMGGTVLPSLARGAGRRDEVGSNGEVAKSPQDDLYGEIGSTSEELDKRRRREDEADLHGWHSSGITRTGDGYDDGDSNHTD